MVLFDQIKYSIFSWIFSVFLFSNNRSRIGAFHTRTSHHRIWRSNWNSCCIIENLSWIGPPATVAKWYVIKCIISIGSNDLWSVWCHTLVCLEVFKKEQFYVRLKPFSFHIESSVWWWTQNIHVNPHSKLQTLSYFLFSSSWVFFYCFFFLSQMLISLTIAIWMICWPFDESYLNSSYVTNRINFSLPIQIGFPLIP